MESSMARTAIVYREEMLKHDTGLGHPERASRLAAIVHAFEQAGLSPPRLDIEPATSEDLLRVHSKRHVVSIQKICATDGDYPDPDTPMVEASWDAALLSAGGVLSACKAVLEGSCDNAFCVVRPPGHHAERDWAMGFCLFNNAAIAARWLRDVRGLSRVAILDWDVHHGNGTQHAFYDDETVYYVSLHQYPHYPGTGRPEERGAGNTNLNLPMRVGFGPKEWLEALDEHVVPELRRFDPQFLLISNGFDAHRLDPLGGQELESRTYGQMTRRIKELAEGRIVSMLEGGYHLQALGESAVEHLQALQE